MGNYNRRAREAIAYWEQQNGDIAGKDKKESLELFIVAAIEEMIKEKEIEDHFKVIDNCRESINRESKFESYLNEMFFREASEHGASSETAISYANNRIKDIKG